MILRGGRLRRAGVTTLASVSTAGVRENSASFAGNTSANFSIGADGQRVAFHSSANNPVPGDVFLHELGTPSLLSGDAAAP